MLRVEAISRNSGAQESSLQSCQLPAAGRPWKTHAATGGSQYPLLIHTHLFTRAILPTRIVSSINKRQAAPALSLGEAPGKEEFKTTTMTTSPNPQPVGWLTYIENSPLQTEALIWIQQRIFQQKRNFLPCPAVSYTQEGVCHQFLGLKNNNLRDNRRGGFYGTRLVKAMILFKLHCFFNPTIARNHIS